ncbi:MAG: triose-phosphate isomerase [Actinomycetales bacterium]|nr:triose-phosphate isomerase [Actinomycetales bacterium]
MSERMALMVGNWKLHFTHIEAIAYVQKLAFRLTDDDYARAEVAVLPPFTALRSVQTIIDADRLRIRYGSQDISAHPSGPYTGEVAGGMLAKLGCTFALVGHSERRQHHGEDDALVNAKLQAALSCRLTPILAVGESLPVRQAGNAISHTVNQLRAGLAGVSAEQAADMVIAYEPIWAIGTGEVATPADAGQMAGELRAALVELYSAACARAVRILYGGSVKASNIRSLMAQDDIDGALVGGASLDPEEFARIVRWPAQS